MITRHTTDDAAVQSDGRVIHKVAKAIGWLYAIETERAVRCAGYRKLYL
jgi:hypothetical protein